MCTLNFYLLVFIYRIYFGPPRIIRKTYYVCAEGFQQLMISLPGQRPLYICDEEAVIVDPEEEGSAELIIDGSADTTDETTEESTSDRTETSGTTEGPTWPGGLKECPSDPSSYQTNDYVFSSL